MNKTEISPIITEQYHSINRVVGIKVGKTLYSVPICIEERVFDDPTLTCRVCRESCKISDDPEECTLMSGLTISHVYHEIEVEAKAGVFIDAQSKIGKKLLKKIQSTFRKMSCVCNDCRLTWEYDFEHVDIVSEII